MTQEVLEKTVKDYSTYLTNTNLDKKLEPINKAVDDMLARLEEFETMFAFIQPDVQDSRDLLKSILDYKPEFDDLCQKIDSTEFLMAHIKSNLDSLESQIEEGEAWLGVEHSNNVAEKVSSILTPLFKKSVEKKNTVTGVGGMELFKTEEYFK